MSQSATEANTITTQPLISPMNIAEPNSVMENMANIPICPDIAAEVITTQPMMNDPNDEEQNKKKQERIDDNLESISEVAHDAMWCCFSSPDCAHCSYCTGCDNCCDDCGDCCGDSGDCCTSCCDGGPSDNVNIDGDDVAGCLECCTSCFECCSTD